VQQADTNHKLAIANGSTDPTFGAWYTWNASDNNPNGLQTLGLSVNIPLRVFDRNQGENSGRKSTSHAINSWKMRLVPRSSAMWIRPTPW
jgi:hypothetical protein